MQVDIPGLSPVVIDLKAQFHMLAHFSTLDEKLRHELVIGGFSESEMERALALPGSRFSAGFATTVSGLLNRLKGMLFRREIGVNGNMVLRAVFERTDFEAGIGTLAVIPAETLGSDERKRLTSRLNRGVELWHFEVERLPVTWECSVILKPEVASLRFITAFPGPPALPLPHEGMDPEMFQQCSVYWKSQVFLSAKLDVK